MKKSDRQMSRGTALWNGQKGGEKEKPTITIISSAYLAILTFGFSVKFYEKELLLMGMDTALPRLQNYIPHHFCLCVLCLVSVYLSMPPHKIYRFHYHSEIKSLSTYMGLYQHKQILIFVCHKLCDVNIGNLWIV